jgi:phage N-6-adenine-methyltransferase
MKKNDELQTPDWLYNQLNERFKFTIDVACTEENCKVFERHFDNLCRKWITRPAYFGSEMGLEPCDALVESWKGQRVFCNPPYSEKKKWIKKAIHEVENNGCPVCVMILPFTMEAVLEIGHYHYDLLKKRVSFIYPETGKPLKGNNCGTMIVYFWREIDEGI